MKICPSAIYLPPNLRSQVFVELEENAMGGVVSLIRKQLGKGVPLVVGGATEDVAEYRSALTGLDVCAGWSFSQSTVFEMNGEVHSTYRFYPRTVLFAAPDKFPTKLPPYFLVDQGDLRSSVTIAAAGFLLKSMGICPRSKPLGENEVPTPHWFLVVSTKSGLVSQLFKCIPEEPSLVVAFTGNKPEYTDYVEALTQQICDMDAFHVVDWHAWEKGWNEGTKLVTLGTQLGEEDAVGDTKKAEESSSEEEEEEKKAKDKAEKKKKEKTPQKGKKKKPESDDDGSAAESPPSKKSKASAAEELKAKAGVGKASKGKK